MNFNKSDLQLGVSVNNGRTVFRLFFPAAQRVKCILFKNFSDNEGDSFQLVKRNDGVWEGTVEEDMTGWWYLYSVDYIAGKKPDTLYASEPFPDPYSRHVTAKNHYRQNPKTLITDDTFDWEGDRFVIPPDPSDLVIYETHIKDLVHHKSSNASGAGIYRKWLDKKQTGGIPYLNRLGVNAVEFLPLHKFPIFEPPYRKKTEEGILNTWNVCSKNHWGYMTSFFFAPETTYASDGGTTPDEISGMSQSAMIELKTLVKELHKNGISVIMDVVFNHTSIFDINPLNHHLPNHYLRRDENGELMNRSWTGNEFSSENPVARKLILDSISYWMREYHIDGFRFDLAGLIDEQSWDAIRERAKAINPNVLLIAEPWGGRYVPWLFTEHGWSSWNDKFRNGIKGSSPSGDKGFIFSDWHQDANRMELENLFRGTLKGKEGGLFLKSNHSVNYLESHDGYTLGDFIRIVSRYHGKNPVITDRDSHLKLTDKELKIAKLAAFCLFVSQGIVMINSGQEFARTKIIESCDPKDTSGGTMDHNSYNRDNETNWINFDDLEFNRSLFEYYKGLISIRKESASLRNTQPDNIHFSPYADPLKLAVSISSTGTDDLSDYYAAINGSEYEMAFTPPPGTWEVIVNADYASVTALDFVYNETVIPSQSAMLLRKLRH